MIFKREAFHGSAYKWQDYRIHRRVRRLCSLCTRAYTANRYTLLSSFWKTYGRWSSHFHWAQMRKTPLWLPLDDSTLRICMYSYPCIMARHYLTRIYNIRCKYILSRRRQSETAFHSSLSFSRSFLASADDRCNFRCPGERRQEMYFQQNVSISIVAIQMWIILVPKFYTKLFEQEKSFFFSIKS